MFATATRIALTLVLVASMQSYGFIEASFALNRDEIAARYCVNLDRPELHCDGACELTRRLEAQNDREQEQQTALVGVALSATMWLAPVDRLERPPAADVAAFARPVGTRAARGTPGGVFHPPEQA